MPASRATAAARLHERGITWWDGGSYPLAAVTLGIPAPPGSLLLTLLGWLVSRIPVNEETHALILDELTEVSEANPARGPDEVVLGERERQGDRCGRDDEHGKPDDEGRKHDHQLAPLPHVHETRTPL